MLIKLNGAAEWVDLEQLETSSDVSEDEAGPGAITLYRGTPGWVCFSQKGGKLVLVNARHVVSLRAAEGGGTLLGTAREYEVLVQYDPELAADLLNKARLHVR